MSGIVSQFKRLQEEEGVEILAIKQEYALRSKVLDLLDLKLGQEKKEREFDARIRDHKNRLKNIESLLAAKRAETQGIRSGIGLEEQAPSRHEALAGRPYSDCPNNCTLETCTHGDLKNNYVRMKNDNLRLAREAANTVAVLQVRLREAEAAMGRSDVEARNVSNQIASAAVSACQGIAKIHGGDDARLE